MHKCSAAALLLGAAIFAPQASAQTGQCEALKTEFSKALKAGDIATVRSLRVGGAHLGCEKDQAEMARRAAALLVQRASMLKDQTDTETETEREELLTEASEGGHSWLASYAYAEMRMEQHKYQEALRAFNDAIEIVNSKEKTPLAPPRNEVDGLVNRTGEAAGLAAMGRNGETGGQFVPMRKIEGVIGGLWRPQIRDVRITSVPIPIGFELNSAQLTEAGAKYAKELAEAIKQQGDAKVILTGHTDKTGPYDFNMKLSGERAETVKQFLKEQGVAAQIITVAKGPNEPVYLDDTARTEQESLALNRRVEWRRPENESLGNNDGSR